MSHDLIIVLAHITVIALVAFLWYTNSRNFRHPDHDESHQP